MATDARQDLSAELATDAPRQHISTDHAWSAEELFDYSDPPWRFELVDGELYRMAPTGFDHGHLESLFTAYLTIHVVSNRLGKVVCGDAGFVVERSPDTVLAPDVAYLSNESLKQAGSTKKMLEIAPDLVAEVVSPSDRPREVQAKVARWLAFGVRAVVVIEPERREVSVYRSIHDKHLYQADETIDFDFVVPGFFFNVAKLFD